MDIEYDPSHPGESMPELCLDYLDEGMAAMQLGMLRPVLKQMLDGVAPMSPTMPAGRRPRRGRTRIAGCAYRPPTSWTENGCAELTSPDSTRPATLHSVQICPASGSRAPCAPDG